jgi:hypothetical protein
MGRNRRLFLAPTDGRESGWESGGKTRSLPYFTRVLLLTGGGEAVTATPILAGLVKNGRIRPNRYGERPDPTGHHPFATRYSSGPQPPALLN